VELRHAKWGVVVPLPIERMPPRPVEAMHPLLVDIWELAKRLVAFGLVTAALMFKMPGTGRDKATVFDAHEGRLEAGRREMKAHDAIVEPMVKHDLTEYACDGEEMVP
jgi:hypothetical protein